MRRTGISRTLVTACFVLGSTLGYSSASGATKPITPKVGDCYLVPESEINSPFSSSAPINCSKKHNAETYKFAKWNGPANPSTLSEVERRGIADQICKPTQVLDDFFNSWSYKIPSSTQWKSGNRFIRCDLVATVSDSETVTFKSWKGKKLKK
jgi:hypothetical protein